MEFSYRIEEKQDRCVIYMSGNLIEKSQALELLERIEDMVTRGVVNLLIDMQTFVGSSRVDLQACKLEYSIVSPK